MKSARRLILLCVDFAILLFVYLVNGALIYLSETLPLEPIGYVINFCVFAFVIFTLRLVLKIYSNVWRYANSSIYLSIVVSDIAAGVLIVFLGLFRFADSFTLPLWQSISFVTMTDIVTLCSRFVYRIYYKFTHRDSHEEGNGKINIAIIGAGQVGTLLAEELLYNSASHYTPVCFVDKDKRKIGSRVLGLGVYPEDDSVFSTFKTLGIQEVFIALPKMSSEETMALHEFYAKTGCKVKLYDFPIKEDGTSFSKRVVRDVKIEDLLFRNSMEVSGDFADAYYSGKTVLVTGGGGSIGSELCRQIAACSPKKLVIFDIYENNAYDIQQELIRKYGDALDLVVEIGSVRDVARLDGVFEAYKPEVVVHAAAHKHVPLMEHSGTEAIKNNVFGTYNTANMAEKHGVEKFILISTDKAVNPTNVMGASKRLCEMVVQCRTDSKTAFCAVRFGNVLGSNGSVIPLFKRQIEAGGPITITDKRIIRYFMTIPEAAGLVMQAGAMANRGELFVLDMGKPVKIIDLAENMIRLSGFVPYKDIEITEVGLRPGEKLYEELLMKTESLTKTENKMIFIERDTPYTRAEVEEKLDKLRTAVTAAERTVGDKTIIDVIADVVPTYCAPEAVNSKAEHCAEMKMANVG